MADSQTRVAKVLLDFELQKQHIAETRAGVAALQKDVANLGPTALKSGEGVQFLSRQMTEARERARNARDASAEFRAELLGLDNNLKNASTGTTSLAGNLTKVREELQKTKAAAVDAGPSLDSLTGDDITGGGRRNTFGLRTAGRELKALPAVQIPGLPISSDAIGKISQLLGSLSPVAVAAGAGIAGLSIALGALTEQAKKAKEAAQGELDSRRKVIELITTGSKEDIQTRINELNAKRKANQAAADDANALLTNVRSDTVRQYGIISATLSEFNATIGTNSGELSAAKENADKANKALGETSVELGLLQQASGLTAQSTEDLIAKEKQLAEVRAKLSVLSENAADLKQILDLEATGVDTKAVQELADAKRREIEVNQFYEKAARDLANTLEKGTQGYIDAIAAADGYHEAIERDRNFINRLSQSTFELVGARQKEAETITAVTKFNDERVKATDDYLAKITDIETKNAEKLIALAVKKADAEEAALAKLVDKIAALNLSAQRAVEDAATKQQRDDLDQQEKFQRQQAKDARDHANKLIEIQQDANNKAEDLIAARDFSGLFRLRRDTNIAIQNENTQYAQQAADRLEAFNQERSDRLRDYARQAEDRNLKYQRDLADAQAQYTRELKAATDNYNKALILQQAAAAKERALLQNKYTEQNRLLQNSITSDLQMIQQGNVARAILQNAANQTLLQQAQQLLSGLTGLAGNALGLGVPSNTNTVNNSNRSVNANFSINGGNSQNIAVAVRQQLQYLVN